MKRGYLFVLLPVLLLCSLLEADDLDLSDKEVEALLDKQKEDTAEGASLANLLTIKVSVASKKAEEVLFTPAIVTRLDVEDLNRLGLRSMRELLSFAPGFVVDKGSTSPGSQVMIRGLTEPFHQKLLFMVNGIPYSMASHSQIGLLGIPMSAISHIEIIRGPGTVHYGSNASAGVINVITKETGKNHIAYIGGSNQFGNLSGFYNRQIKDDIHFSLAFETQNHEGYEGYFRSGITLPAFYPVNTPQEAFVKRSIEKDSVMATLRVREHHFLFQAFQSESLGVAGLTSTVNLANWKDKGRLFHYNREWKLNKATVKVYTDYNQFYFEVPTEHLILYNDGRIYFEDDGDENYRWRSGVSVAYSIKKDMNLFVGVESEKKSTGEYFQESETIAFKQSIMREDRSLENSFFTQVDYEIEKWRFLIGARFTDNNKWGEELTPRLSALYKLKNNQSLKLIYSEGFNGPNFSQQNLLVSGLITGDPNLKPEKVKSADLAYTIKGKDKITSINYYYLWAEDFIQRSWDPNALLIKFNNNGSYQRSGIELDYQQKFMKWNLNGNLAYNFEGNRKDSTDVAARFIPRFTSALGLSYYFKKNQSIGLSSRFYSTRNLVSSKHRLNVNYTYKRKKHEMFVTIRNLLSEDLSEPDTGNFIDSVVHVGDYSQTNFLAGFKLKF